MSIKRGVRTGSRVDDEGRLHVSWGVDLSNYGEHAAECAHLSIEKWLKQHETRQFVVSTVRVDKSPGDPLGYYINVLLYGGEAVSDQHPARYDLEPKIRIKYTCK